MTLAPCIEGLILLDRLCYLKEQVKTLHPDLIHWQHKCISTYINPGGGWGGGGSSIAGGKKKKKPDVFTRITELLCCGRIYVGSLWNIWHLNVDGGINDCATPQPHVAVCAQQENSYHRGIKESYSHLNWQIKCRFFFFNKKRVKSFPHFIEVKREWAASGVWLVYG